MRSTPSEASASRYRRGRRAGQPGSPSNAGRRTVERSSPCAAMRVVTVSASTHAMRAGHTSAASVSVTSVVAACTPFTIWPTGPRAGSTGSTSVTEAFARAAATAPSGSNEHDDDGRRAPGPRDVGEATHAGRPVRVREGGRRARGEDDGGDGHDWLLQAVRAVYRRRAGVREPSGRAQGIVR